MAVYHQPAQSNAPAGVTASDAERSAFAMLHRECVLRMAGMFSQSFWTVDVMRATQVYPAVWHAGLAIAAMHRATCITAQTAQARESRQRNQAFALTQYNAAVMAVLALTKKPALAHADKETILLASTLFTCLCCLQEDYEQASEHAKGGNRLYWRWQYGEPDDTVQEDEHYDGDGGGDEDIDDLTCTTPNYRVDNPGSRRPGCVLTTKALTAAFTHFEMQFCNRFRTVEIPEWRWRQKAHRCSDAPFTSAADAYTELQPLIAGYCHIGRYLSVPCNEAAGGSSMWRSVQAYVGELLAWKDKFYALLARREAAAAAAAAADGSPPPDDEEEEESIFALRILWMSVETFLTHTRGSGELAWDEHTPALERVTAYAEQHVAARKAKKKAAAAAGTAAGGGGRAAAARRFTFSFAMSACEVLSFVGTNCRDGGIRRRLIALLRDWHCRDGMMDGRLLALIVQTIMVLEENATTGMQERHKGCTCVPGEFICGDHRVCLIDTQFLGERSAKIILKTAGMLKENLPAYEQGVSW